MKNLLITGNVASLAAHLCQRLSRQYHMVVAARQTPPLAFGKGVEVVALDGGKTLEQVFQAYSFHAMVFLATRGEQVIQLSGEADLLSSALALCKRHGVEKALYLASGELSRPTEASGERGMLMQAMEQLCTAYRQQGVFVTSLRLPLVFGPGEDDTLIGRMLFAAAGKETVNLPYSRDAQLDFISAAEVAQLAYRILDRSGKPEDVVPVRGAEMLTVRELTALFGLLGASVSQGADETGCPPMEGSDLQRSYGFTPAERLSVALDSLYISAKGAREKQNAQGKRLRLFLRRHGALVKGTSLLLGYGALEGLLYLQSSANLPAMDLRLVYVALMGAAHGLPTGLMSVVLASFSIALGYGAKGMDVSALLHDAKAWLPFLPLILTGSVTGYARDRGRRQAADAKENALVLEKRCDFLQDLYKQSLLAKDQPVVQAEDHQEQLLHQLTQLRKGQDRLEQEWLTLMRKEQERWDSQQEEKKQAAEEAKQELTRSLSAAREKEQLEQMQAEEALRLQKFSAEQNKHQGAAPYYKENDASLRSVSLDRMDSKTVNLSDTDLPESLDDDLFQGQADEKKQSMRNKRRDERKQKAKEESLDEESLLPTGSPFGRLSPEERKRMLEAMQVRARAKLPDKQKRKKER